MATTSNWRSTLAATARYENIARLKKCMEARGLSSAGNSHKAAFAAETEAYNSSESIEAYKATCAALLTTTPSSTSSPSTLPPEPTTPGISIGPHPSCHHLSSSLISQVYRTKTLALKVITETNPIEPHNPAREIQILKSLTHPNIITLTTTFRDQDSRLVLVFPFLPLTLSALLSAGPIPLSSTKSIFHDLFSALAYLHERNIIHRDIKPSNILLSSPSGPTKATLIDFGTAFHPTLSPSTLYPPPEFPSQKHIEVGSTCYRAPETLFGHRTYSIPLDLWSTGVMLSECLRSPPVPLFQSRESHEDGNQLGLILSMFKTLGTPTEENWPEAKGFSTPPFEWYAVFPGKGWEELLPEVGEEGRGLVGSLVRWESGWRMAAKEALEHAFFKEK